jgi:hypothetical protein
MSKNRIALAEVARSLAEKVIHWSLVLARLSSRFNFIIALVYQSKKTPINTIRIKAENSLAESEIPR